LVLVISPEHKLGDRVRIARAARSQVASLVAEPVEKLLAHVARDPR
jgi:hypothetical protein